MRLHVQDGELQALLRRHWGDGEGATSEEMRKEIERLARVARTGGGEPFRGKKLFMGRCGRCHTLFEEGGQVGPDLTSFDRNDVDRILLNIVNPSAEVREGFETHLVLTKDGRRLDGFLVEETAQALVLRVPDGQNSILAKDEIERRAVSKMSLMPEGLIKDLKDEEVRDLFAYLRSTQPVPK
jgi:putative heme-binding domain-containing protein